jgi:hypothetical protein
MTRCNDYDHFRKGTDCGLCPCPQFIPPLVGAWRQFADWIQDRFSRG